MKTIKRICVAALLGVVIVGSLFYFTDTRLDGEVMRQLSQYGFGYRVYKRIYNHRVYNIEQAITENVSFDDYTIKADWVKDTTLSNIQSIFYFSNENCSDIVNLHQAPYPIPNNGKDWLMSHYTDQYPLTADRTKANNYVLEFVENGFNVVSDSLDNHWIYIISKNIMPSKYAVEFDYFSKTAICEQLQFDIYASSLADRFRVISAYGERLFFDAVQKGYFLKRFYEKDCLMAINTTNHIRLEVDENHIVYYVNNKKELCVSIDDYPIKPGHLIILFWNNVDKEPIDISVRNFLVYTEKGGSNTTLFCIAYTYD